MPFKETRDQNYKSLFRIEHLTYRQNLKSNQNTLEQEIKNKISTKELQENFIFYNTSSQKVVLRKLEIKSDHLKLFISVADLQAQLPVTPGQTHLQDMYPLDDLDTHHVFLLIQRNKILGSMKISHNSLSRRINLFLSYLNIDGNVTSDIDISSAELIRDEGVRGFIYYGEQTSEDTNLIAYEEQRNKGFFNNFFGEEPPIFETTVIGNLHFNLKDNQATIKKDPTENIDEVVQFLHPGLVLVTSSGKRITGQNFAVQNKYYLREHAKNSVNTTSAFITLETQLKKSI